MKKNLYIKSMVISILLVVVILSGCNAPNEKKIITNEDRIIGTWFISKQDAGGTMNITYIFGADKTYEVFGTYNDETENFKGNWEIVDNKLVVTIEGESQTAFYEFSNNDKTLTITVLEGDSSIVLTKQE
jgi:hypothetical protein